MSRKRKANKYTGGTITIVIAAVLIIVLFGVSIVLMCQQFYLSREGMHTIDSAALNVAKKALREPTVNVRELNLMEFSGLGTPNPDEISIETYNRAVGKTLMVAIVAEEEGTAAAMGAARHMKEQLDKLNRALTKKLETSNELSKAFDEMAIANMLKDGQVKRIKQANTIKWTCMEGGASSIFFDSTFLNGANRTRFKKYFDTEGPKAPNGEYFLKGYVPIEVAGLKIEALTIFPGKQPHLISLTDFEKSKKKKHDCLPNAMLLESVIGGTGLKQMAAAVVGNMKALDPWDANDPNRVDLAELGAAIDPTSTIVFINSPPTSASGLGGELVSDGDNDLFNKELFSPSRIVQSTNGVFTTDEAQMQAWIAFNNGNGPNPSGSYDVRRMRKGSTRDAQASGEDLEGIREVLCECTHTMYTGELSGPCADETNIKTWAKNFRRWSVTTTPPPEGFSAFETAKLELLQGRARFSKNFEQPRYDGDAHESGMKIFQENKIYACPPCPINFSKVGTILEIIEQTQKRSEGLSMTDELISTGRGAFSSCTGGTFSRNAILQRITKEAARLKPGTSEGDVRALLAGKKFPPGKIYTMKRVDEKLVLEDGGGGSADGKRYATGAQLKATGTFLNSPGDANFADAPFSWAAKLRGETWFIHPDSSSNTLFFPAWELVTITRGTGSAWGRPAPCAVVEFNCGIGGSTLECPN